MSLRALTILLILLIKYSIQDDYEAIENICTKCKCDTKYGTLVLDCSNLDFHHILPKWPEHSEHLIASFNNNNITKLQQLPASNANTISLSISHCEIKELETELFIDATGIEFVDLSWNYLTGQELKPDTFRGRYDNIKYEPIGLEELNLAHNQIESLGKSVFEHTPNLTRLNLSYNPLRVLDASISLAISSLIKLRSLNLANTSIKKIPDTMLSRLHRLQTLDLSRNQLEDVPVTLSYLSRNLEILKLNENRIKHFYQESFYGLYALKELNISGMPHLETVQTNTFKHLKKLRTLHCTDNPKLHEIHHDAFGNGSDRPNIRELYLSNNHLETLSQFLLDWSKLEVIDLTGNRWDCNCELYYIILSVNDTNSGVVIPTATCCTPPWASGIVLKDVSTLERACEEIKILDMVNRSYENRAYRIFIRSIIVLLCIVLTLTVCYFFWRVLQRYHSIRSVNTMYPVMYISTPTSDY